MLTVQGFMANREEVIEEPGPHHQSAMSRPIIGMVLAQDEEREAGADLSRTAFGVYWTDRKDGYMSMRPGSERPRSIVVMVAFVYLWLMVSIAVTTLTLNGPVRWVTGRPDLAVWADEILVLIPATMAVLLASFLLTRWLLRRVILSRTQVARVGIPVAVTLIAVVSAWAWLTAPYGPSVDMAPDQDVSLAREVDEL